MADEPIQTSKGTEETPTPKETEVETTTNQTAESTEELPVEKEIDYKTKFSESKEEALRIREENKILSQEKADLEAKLANASESSLEKDLSVKYPDWDVLTDSERAIIKRQESMSKELAAIKEEKAWEADLAQAKSRFPKLSGKEEEFKKFCYKYPKSIDAETLAKSFLFEETPVKEEIKPRKGLEKPTSGPNKVLTPEMTLDDIKRLRETDEKQYIKLIREGRLNVPKE